MGALEVPLGKPRWWVGGTIAIIAVCGALAGVTHQPLLVPAAIAGLFFFVLAVTVPIATLSAFVVLTFVSQLSGVGATVSLAKGAGAVLIASWAYRALAQRGTATRGSIPQGFALASLALVGWMFLSSTWADDPQIALSSTLRLAQGPLLVLYMASTIKTLRGFQAVLTAYIFGATLSAVVGMAGVTQADNSALAVSGRLSGGISDPNFLAAVLIPALMISLFAAHSVRLGLVRVGLAFACLACLTAIFLTESRGGIVGLAVATVVAIVYAGPIRRKIVMSVLATAAFATVYFTFAPPQSLHRLTSFTAGGGGGRSDLWAVATKAFTANPVLGVGAGNYTIQEPRFLLDIHQRLARSDLILAHVEVHNTYLQLAAELGVVGVVIFVLTVLSPLLACRAAVSLSEAAGEWRASIVGRGLFAGTIGMLTAFVFLTAQYQKQLWVTLGLVLAYSRISERSPEVVPSELVPDVR
jgi:O-antigen ligase